MKSLDVNVGINHCFIINDLFSIKVIAIYDSGIGIEISSNKPMVLEINKKESSSNYRGIFNSSKIIKIDDDPSSQFIKNNSTLISITDNLKIKFYFISRLDLNSVNFFFDCKSNKDLFVNRNVELNKNDSYCDKKLSL